MVFVQIALRRNPSQRNDIRSDLELVWAMNSRFIHHGIHIAFKFAACMQKIKKIKEKK